jgi:hypothetical protein
MVTETALLGTVIEYHTSLAVPQVLNGVPTVAWYSEALICVQLVPGGNSVGEEQSSFDGWEKAIWEIRIRQKNRRVFLAVGFIVLDFNLEIVRKNKKGQDGFK